MTGRPDKTPRNEAFADLVEQVKDQREINIAQGQPGTPPMSDNSWSELDERAGHPPRR